MSLIRVSWGTQTCFHLFTVSMVLSGVSLIRFEERDWEQLPITQAVPVHSACILLLPSPEHHYTFHPFWRLFRGPIIDHSLTRNLLESDLVFYAWVWFYEKVVRNRDFPVALTPNKKPVPWHWDTEGFSGVSFGVWLTDMMFIDLWACPSHVGNP